jgi:hypothetical protein
MNFMQPAMLLGLLAAAIPIVIHLINRQRAQRRPFPAVEFLLRSQQKLARRLRLKQWLLLALRVSIFVFLPLALSLPFWDCGGAAVGIDGRLPASIVLVIDDSASMVREDGVEAVRDAATRQIRDLRTWDQVAVVFASDTPRMELGDLTDDHGRAIDVVENTAIYPGSTALDRALAAAREIQQTSRQPVQRTVWITDLAVAGWGVAGFDPSMAEGLGTLEVVDISDGNASNLAITELDYVEADDAGTDAWRLSASLQAWEYPPGHSVAVELLVDGTPVGTAVTEISAEGTASASLVHTFATGGAHTVTARIQDNDGILSDNERQLRIRLDQGIRVLLVNGDARAVQYNDELFYLERALGASFEDNAAATVTTVTADRFSGAELNGVDVVVLANVAGLPATTVTALTQFVEQGGGLLLTAGDNVDPARWSNLFAGLLPKPVRDITRLSAANDPDVAIKSTRLAELDARHPIFRVFSLPGGESIQSVMVFAYLLLEPAPVDGARTLASFGDGGPALVERRLGEGRVLLLTTSIDYDWTSLPIRTTFLPLVQRMVEYLAQQGGTTVTEAAVGQRLQMDVEAWTPDRVIVVPPAGERVVLLPEDGQVLFTPRATGLHQVLVGNGDTESAVDSLSFTANIPFAESNPTRLDESLLLQAQTVAANSRPQTETGTELTAGQRSLWPVLLFCVLLVLYAETLVSVRRKLWQGFRRKRPDLTGL